jgi:cellulose biosynthesis protein BcsQ
MMHTRDLLIASTLTGLSDELVKLADVRVTAVASLEHASAMITSRQFHATYIDHDDHAPGSVWSVILDANRHGVTVLMGLSPGIQRIQHDLHDAGIMICPVQDATGVARWITAQLGLRSSMHLGSPVIAIAGAKGGIGKTLTTSLLAEGLTRRGVRVLVIDGDLSNSGIVPMFRIPADAPSYLDHASDAVACGMPPVWEPAQLRRLIFGQHPSGIDFLIGADGTADVRDLQRIEWLSLIEAARGLGEYGAILIDTGPEIKKRPYAILAARDGGWVVVPAPPGRKERTGVAHLLHVMQRGIPEHDLSARCLLVLMEPERGSTVTPEHVAPLLNQQFPAMRIIGRIPRAVRQISTADECNDRYMSPIDVDPGSRMAQATHQMVERLCLTIGLTPPLPMPRSPWWARWRRTAAWPASPGRLVPERK